MLNEQLRQYKNVIQGHLLETGIALNEKTKERLLKPQHGLEVFETLDLPHTIRLCVIMNLYLLWNLFEQKEILKREIYKAGKTLEPLMKRLITIKGVTPLLALAFLSDVGDISRFSSARKLNAYLGVVPTVHASGGKATLGHINKRSRSLSRALFSQIVYHFANSSPEMYDFYTSTKARRDAGRSRIAILRRLFSIMRRMLLDNQDYRWKNEINVQNKLVDYEAEMKKLKF
jgi:transposase